MTVLTESRLSAAAKALRVARDGLRPADLPPEAMPQSPAEAYRVQDLVVGDDPVAGWKILATASPEKFSCGLIAQAARLPDGATLARGLRRPEVEVEIAIRIAADLPAEAAPHTEDSVRAALGTAHAAFEIVESRFEDRKAANPLATLADGQSCRAVVIGSGVADWQALALDRLDIVLEADGQQVVRVQGGADVAQILAALTWLANHAAGRGRGLERGQYVITGARIGPFEIPDAGQIRARVAQIGEVGLSIKG